MKRNERKFFFHIEITNKKVYKNNSILPPLDPYRRINLQQHPI